MVSGPILLTSFFAQSSHLSLGLPSGLFPIGSSPMTRLINDPCLRHACHLSTLVYIWLAIFLIITMLRLYYYSRTEYYLVRFNMNRGVMYYI